MQDVHTLTLSLICSRVLVSPCDLLWAYGFQLSLSPITMTTVSFLRARVKRKPGIRGLMT